MANAALAADDTLRALRFKFVPARLTEEEFWRCYFWHVANVKCELLHDWRTANGARREAAIEEERSLAPMVGSSSSSQQQQSAKASGAEGLRRRGGGWWRWQGGGGGGDFCRGLGRRIREADRVANVARQSQSRMIVDPIF